MPQFLGLVRIDLHYDQAPEELRAAIVEANAQLDSTHHTFDTFNEQLKAVAEAHPALVADALIEDCRNYCLYRLADGEVRELALDPKLEDGTEADELPFDEVGTVRL